MTQQYPKCMIYLGDNKYQCSKNKFPIITVLPENLPITCMVCDNSEIDNSLEINNDSQNNQENAKRVMSIKQQIKNFTSSIINYTKSGFKNVTTEEYKERINVCNNCEYLDKNNRCSECGCFVAVKNWMESEKCPKNKW
jgi:hypothetical protein